MEEYLQNHNKIMKMFQEQGLSRDVSTKSAKLTGDFPSQESQSQIPFENESSLANLNSNFNFGGRNLNLESVQV